jgi:hypothetical protein
VADQDGQQVRQTASLSRLDLTPLPMG